MTDYILSCCSTADLSKELFQKREIHYICFHYELDGKQYSDDLGKSMDFHEFYQAMVNGAETRTSQVNAEEYEAYLAMVIGFLHSRYNVPEIEWLKKAKY